MNHEMKLFIKFIMKTEAAVLGQLLVVLHG